MCLSNKQTNTRYCLFDRLEKFCLFVWSEVVKRTKQSVQVLFGDHPGFVLVPEHGGTDDSTETSVPTRVAEATARFHWPRMLLAWKVRMHGTLAFAAVTAKNTPN